MDPLAALVTYLAGVPGIASVHVELPHDEQLRSLPCIDLQPAGPAARHPALLGLGFDTQDIDVDLYVSAGDWRRGLARPLATRVRVHLDRFRSGPMAAVGVTAPHKLPDRNPDIRRLGMTVSVRLPAHI